MKKKFLLLLMVSCLSFAGVMAQCAMCKRTAETDMESTQKKSAGRSLNSGILYLLSIPYVIGAVSAIVWWKSRKREN